MRNAARQANQIAGLGLHPDAVELEIQHPFLHQDELILCRMNMHWHELAGFAVGLEGKGGIGHGLGEVDLTENIPALATVTGTTGGDAFFECCHIVLSSVEVWSTHITIRMPPDIFRAQAAPTDQPSRSNLSPP